MLLYGCQGLSEALLSYKQESHIHHNTEGLQRSLGHFYIGLETTQVEKSPIEPVVNFRSTRKAITNKKEYGTQIDSEESRCDNTSLLHPCTDGERFCFISVDEDSCCHRVVEKSQDCDEVSRTSTSGQNSRELHG